MESKPIFLNAPKTATPEEGLDARQLGAAGLPANPFVGLRPFESTEELLFFGRRAQTKELLDILNASRFMAIVGSSGCGKSSLIRAGLIPNLEAGFFAGRRDRWSIATMKPGDSPLRNLAAALMTAFSEEPSAEQVGQFVEEVRLRGLNAVTDYLKGRMQASDTNLLLLVDQFEEIFRFGSYDAAEEKADGEKSDEEQNSKEKRRSEANDFVSIMLNMARQELFPVYVVMTMRSDFLGDCDAFYGLPEAMNRSQYLVPRLTRQQRQEAIENPIQLYGATITQRLTDRVLNDMGDDSDQLPVMQHAMMRTWEKWKKEQKDEPVDLLEYEQVGMIKEALWRDAEEALEGISAEERTIAERMFQALTETDAKGRRLRRPARLSEIVEITGASRETVLGVIERFRGSNRSFLTFSEDPRRGDPLVDISHESLIRQWETLRNWVDAEDNSRELYLRLAGDAVRYNKEKKEAPLWSDPALQLALDWWAERRPNEAWARRYHKEFALAEDFLRQSKEKREAEAAEAERQAQLELNRARALAEQRRVYNRRLQFVMAALVVLLLLAAWTALYAIRAEKRARQNETEAKAAKAEIERQKLEVERQQMQLEASFKVLETEQANTQIARDDALEAQEKLQGALTQTQEQKARAEREKVAADTARRLVEQAQFADNQHREATKRLDEFEIEDAHAKFREAINGYERTGNLDGVSHTYTEMGRMLILQKSSPFGDTIPKYVLDAVGATGDLDLLGGREALLKQLLDKEQPHGGLLGTLNINPEQKQGLEYLGKAIQTSINRKSPDYNEAGSAWNKIGDFLLTEDEDIDASEDSTLNSRLGRVGSFIRQQAAVDAYCKALAAYEKAPNLKGQISMLKKLGDNFRLENSQMKLSEGTKDNEEANRSQAPRLKTTGRADIGSEPIPYYERTRPLYRELLRQKKNNSEQVKKLREEFVELLLELGGLYSNAQEQNLAAQSFDEAVELYPYPDQIDKRIDTLLAVADKVSAGEKDKYLKWAITETVQRYEGADNYSKQAATLVKIAHGYSALGSTSPPSFITQSIELYQKALSLYQRSGNRDEQAGLYLALSVNYYRQNDAEKAIENTRTALKIYEELADRQGQMHAHYYTGFFQEKAGQIRAAIDSYNAMLKLAGSENVAYKNFAQTAIARLTAQLNAQPSPSPTPTPTPSPE